MSKEDLPPSRTAEQFVVRFPDGMRDRIADAAKVAGRSMNAEIVARLQSTFKPEQMALDLGEMLQGIQDKLLTQTEMIEQLVAGGSKVTVDENGDLLSASRAPKTIKFKKGGAAPKE